MISTDDALAHLFGLVSTFDAERVPLRQAVGRVLAGDMVATRAQPPFAASAMDGYAARQDDVHAGAELRVIGEAPAGAAFDGQVGPGEVVRIFTGAPVPAGADTVVIQENTTKSSTRIRVTDANPGRTNIRPAGGDFDVGDRVTAPRLLRPADIALAAAMNLPELTVRRRPIIAIVTTGDELVQPGEAPSPTQIIASNALGLGALFEEAGAEARLLPIARDTEASLRAALALTEGADLVVTIGGASVGAHDVVARLSESLGLERVFYRVAMRPGKPLMAGRMRGTPMIGLPGNPVSAMVCGHIFVLPMIRVMLGFPPRPAPRIRATLAIEVPQNGPREHYMRASHDGSGVTPFAAQDSSLLTILSSANALLVRPPHDPARPAGHSVDIVPLHRG
ncbi:MAG: gephyrin-like molybdotransferase Glp [Pseudomonadota bacterium]